MTDEESLLAAVRAAPADGLPRLVYADWLDEHGRPERAEFIRVQCELADEDLDPKPAGKLSKRAEKLFQKHRAEWFPAPVGVDYEDVRRGFWELIQATAAEFVEHADALFAAAPTAYELFVTDDAEDEDAEVPDWESFFRCRHLERITVLGFNDFLIDPDAAWRMSKCRWLKNLRKLDLNFSPLGYDGIEELAFKAPRYRRLETLTLVETAIMDRGADALGGSRAFATVTELNLGRCDLSADGIVRLIAGGELKRLRKLTLFDNPIGDAGAEAIAASPLFARLESLDVNRCRVGSRGALALADSPHLKRLTDLRVGGGKISRKAADRLRERFGEGVVL